MTKRAKFARVKPVTVGGGEERIQIDIEVDDDPSPSPELENRARTARAVDSELFSLVLTFDAAQLEYDSVHTPEPKPTVSGGRLTWDQIPKYRNSRRTSLFRCRSVNTSTVRTYLLEEPGSGNSRSVSCEGTMHRESSSARALREGGPILPSLPICLLLEVRTVYRDRVQLAIEIDDDPSLHTEARKLPFPTRLPTVPEPAAEYDVYLYYPTRELIYQGLADPGDRAPDWHNRTYPDDATVWAGQTRWNWRKIWKPGRIDPMVQAASRPIRVMLAAKRGVLRTHVDVIAVTPGADPDREPRVRAQLPIELPVH